MDGRPGMTDIVDDLRRRGASCRELALQHEDLFGEGRRLLSKAQAYEHAAELVEAELGRGADADGQDDQPIAEACRMRGECERAYRGPMPACEGTCLNLAADREHRRLTGPPPDRFHAPALDPVPTPKAREAWDKAQRQADETGEPVCLVLHLSIGGEQGPTVRQWVFPLATFDQWVIVRDVDGTEVPMRKAAES